MNITKKYLINGPNNVIRLSNGKKIIYIYGDVHLNFDNQTVCNYEKKYDSIDFNQFLLKFMKENTKENYDLFIEQTYEQLKMLNPNFNYIYLNNMRRIFSTNINFTNNKIIRSENYPNFRFHYFDFRSDFMEFKNVVSLVENLPPFHLLLNNINFLIDTLNNIKLNLENFYKHINENTKHKKMQKLFIKYENKKIQKKLVKIINDYFKNRFYNTIINLINDTTEYIYNNYDTINNKYLSSNYKLEIMFEIEKKLKFISSEFYNFFQLSDIYLIKRILDKKYNKKSIVYCGLGHLALITYFLVKYFNFKITNIYYLSENIKDTSQLEEKIKKEDFNNDLINYFTNFSNNEEIIQCVNLFNFPINMS